MDLKTITTTLALLSVAACGGEAKKTEVKKTEIKTEIKADVKDVKEVTPPATPDAKADAKKEMACGEGKCGEGKCGAAKTEGDGKAIPVDAAKAGDTKPADVKTSPEKS